MARLIGQELIDKLEELREQYNSMAEILTEIEDSNEQERTTLNAINGGQANFERKAEFLNKEISFLLDNLRRKATDNGLNEDSLLPLTNQRD